MDNNHIYEPLNEYKNIYKDLHDKNTKEFFEELVKKSNVDISLNKETVKKIHKYSEQRKNITKQISNYNGLRIILILVIVVAILISLYNFSLIKNSNNILINVLIGIAGILISALTIFITFKKLNPFLKNLKNDHHFLDNEIERLTGEAKLQMKPLNDLFTDYQHLDLFKKTIPLINLDNSFNIKRFEQLVTNFDLDDTRDNNRSTLFVKSGDISGNPFYIANDIIHTMGMKTYSGSIVISYRTYTTVNGKRVSQTHYQTLTATIQRPFPNYNEQSYILYGNEAAPNLIFSRTDSDAENMTQKQIDKEVTRVEKRLKKKARKAVKKGDDFTLMSHSEFEVLWHATDRNNELEFRLLFTPLAQRELLLLMKDKEIGYGDNFDFIKDRKLNLIIPEHLKMMQLKITKDYYKSYDYKEIENKFISYNNLFFKNIYFAFAPILAIPLYQQHKTQEYIYGGLYEGYESFYEHEMIVNEFGENMFRHNDSNTKNILKTKIIESKENKDIIQVDAYGYQAVNRIDFQTKMGMDGRLHTIPISWVEYIPVTSSTNLEVNIVPEESEKDLRTRIEETFRKLNNHESLKDKDLVIIGKYIARIIKWYIL